MHRPKLSIWAIGLVALLLPAPATARVGHTVTRGDTLWGIAARSNLTTRALAAANGLSPNALIRRGQTIWVPSLPEAIWALRQRGYASSSRSSSGSSARSYATRSAWRSSAPRPLGGYTVRPGDTLSGLAARTGASTAQIAWMNGLSLRSVLRAGTILKLPSASSSAALSARTAPRARYVPRAAPYATAGRVTASQVRQIAAQHAVSPSLAAAIAWQESGFNNSAVSSANARGVMQVLPGTFEWVQSNLAQRRLNPASPSDNVRAGVLYLRQLVRDTGSPSLAVASYYQGEDSVRRIGLLPSTRRYVANVMALRSRFGG